MSDNISKKSSFKKNVSKDNDKGKYIIKNKVDKNDVSVNSPICKSLFDS